MAKKNVEMVFNSKHTVRRMGCLYIGNRVLLFAYIFLFLYTLGFMGGRDYAPGRFLWFICSMEWNFWQMIYCRLFNVNILLYKFN